MATSKTAWMTRDTNELVRTILPTSLQSDDIKVSSELGFETLCSYNWQIDGNAILVPGGPPKWVPPPLPIVLPEDDGRQFKNCNALRVPKYPFEPAFQAMSIMNPNIPLDEVDLIVNRNSLRKLLDFASGKRQDPFCMGLHMVKDTLFITRKEKHARMMIHGAANSGYGHNFEEAFTRPENGLDRSSSHHRVIRYRFGNLDCVVRFEVDAYLEHADEPSPGSTIPQSIDSMTAAMQQLAVHESPLDTGSGRSTPVIPKGIYIDSSQLAETKARKLERLNKAIPQLWFGRTPYLLVGKHDKGVFHSTTCTHAGAQFAKWEESNQEKLRKLANLLVELKRTVQGTVEGAAVLVCEPKGAPLRLFTVRNKQDVLPKEIIMKHWSVGGGVGER
ncbi:Nn.00g023440.m01.CDS01 [Neocucurbitaria sp. VM-36]